MTAPLRKRFLKKKTTQICSDFMQTVQHNYALEKNLMRWANINQKDTFGFTALYWAISHHNMHNLKLLIDNGSTLEVTSSMNALFCAIECNNLEALKYFLDKGIDKNYTRTSRTGKSFTLLEYAKRLKRKVIVLYIK